MYPEESKNIKKCLKETFQDSSIRCLMDKEREYSYGLYMHGIATAVYAGAIAKLMMYQNRISQVTLNQIITGAMIHDIGKVAISHNVIEKAGSLTYEEFAQIKKHPAMGVEIIKVNDPVINNIVKWHHEKMDGSGYPTGISDIPDYVKIVTVADIYDALTSTRPYKKAYPHSETIQIMREEALAGKIDMDIVSGLDLVIKNGALARN